MKRINRSFTMLWLVFFNFCYFKILLKFNLQVNGGGTQISANVFKFDDWPTLYAAQDQMKHNIPWTFYDFNGAGLMVNNQFVPLNPQQTIQTTIITWFSEQTGKFTIQPYEFFKW